MRRIGNDKGDGDKHTPPKEEDAKAEEGKGEVSERAYVRRVVERLLARGQTRPDSGDAKDAERQNQKGTNPNSPAEADQRDELCHHNRKDDAANGRRTHNQTQSSTAFSAKPCRYLREPCEPQP
jgi:hypothetical protein